MNVYLVTSKRTYSRAVVVAETADDAIRTYPADETGHTFCKPDASAATDWHRNRFGGFPRGIVGSGPHSPTVPWPRKISDIEASLVGRTTNQWAPSVLCWQPDDDPRI